MKGTDTVQKELPTLTPQKEMRRSYSRCGFATLTLILVSLAASLTLSLIAEIPAVNEVLAPILSDYFLLINEAVIGISILAGLLVLTGTKGVAPERARLPFRTYFSIFSITVAVSMIGNYLGVLWTMPGDMLAGSGDVSNDVAALLDGQSIWQLILCVVILAPVFEEFFFRKLIIDRLHPHGEFLAILTSGLLFGLFHQNIQQYFYTFGVGILLGYLYVRTGSYIAVTLMHAAFNLVLGVFPSLFAGKVSEILTLLETGETEALLADLAAFLLEYGPALLCYLIHLLLTGGLTIAGILIFIFSVKKIKIKSPPSALSVWDMGTNAYINYGMLAAIMLMLGTTALSLFA